MHNTEAYFPLTHQAECKQSWLIGWCHGGKDTGSCLLLLCLPQHVAFSLWSKVATLMANRKERREEEGSLSSF